MKAGDPPRLQGRSDSKRGMASDQAAGIALRETPDEACGATKPMRGFHQRMPEEPFQLFRLGQNLFLHGGEFDVLAGLGHQIADVMLSMATAFAEPLL